MTSVVLRKYGFLYLFFETALVYLVAVLLYASALLPKDALYFDDGYYHYRMAQMIMSGHAWVSVSWLPMTILGDAGPDHHWFWHLIVAPFTLLGRNDVESLKLATAFTGAIVPAGISLAARLLGLPYAPLVGFLAAASNGCLPYRYLMLRAQTISVVLLFFAVVAMHRCSALALFIIAFLFMDAYHAAIMLLPLTVLWVMIHHSVSEELNVGLVLAVAAGLFGALLLSPWAPKTFEYLWFHTTYKMLSNQHLNIGGEWYPVEWGYLLEHGIVAHLTLCSGLLLFFVRKKLGVRRSPSELSVFLLVASAIGIYAYKHAMRFAEYAAPLEVLAGLSLIRDSGTMDVSVCRQRLLAFILTVLVLVGTGWGLWLVYKTESEYGTTEMYRKAADYLEQHGKPGDMILNPDWCAFVFFFWHTQEFHLVNGLDPHYLAYASPREFELWKIYSADRYTDQDPAVLARDVFHAKWILLNARYPNLVSVLEKSPQAKLVVDDGKNGILFQVMESKVTDKQ